MPLRPTQKSQICTLSLNFTLIAPGEPVLEKLGLQILVILFKTAYESNGNGIQPLLTRLIQKESLLLPLVSCFRHASTDVDSDIIYGSCTILHEFTINEIEVRYIFSALLSVSTFMLTGLINNNSRMNKLN